MVNVGAREIQQSHVKKHNQRYLRQHFYFRCYLVNLLAPRVTELISRELNARQTAAAARHLQRKSRNDAARSRTEVPTDNSSVQVLNIIWQ
jgi:hypothetical protein